MKKLITLGLLGATLAFAGAAFAERGDGPVVKDRDLHEWSTQASQSSGSAVQPAGPGAQPKSSVPPAMQSRGSDSTK